MAKPASGHAPDADRQNAAEPTFTIALKPIGRPELDEIRIDDNLFAIGRSEAPFVTYPAEIVADLSRRHARIFSEFGAVYLADLDSKNGTTLNGIPLRKKPSRLSDGDEVCFGRQLAYQVRLGRRTAGAERPMKLVSLTLSPEHSDLGLQPIVITRFPFLVSKADEIFARYREQHPHQLNYVSRRHAHLFLRNGAPFVEDLGSTNGTFINGKRLDEHAVALHDGDLLAFGGSHLVYRVSQQKEVIAEPTVTKLSLVAGNAAPGAGNADKTTFVAAPDSFLDIFCVDVAPQQDDELNNEMLEASAEAGRESAGRKPGKSALFFAELRAAFAGKERPQSRRKLWWGVALAAALGVVALALYFNDMQKRDLKALLADEEYAQAAAAVRQSLERQPDDPQLKALGSEALLKARLPDWLARIKARDFAGAAAVIAEMKELGANNADVQPLLSELEWIGELERFVSVRGGSDAPIRIFADEKQIGGFLKRWNEDTAGHQRAFTAISSQVPEFGDWYAATLSHLRKLQSDDSVYLAAIDRLKTTIRTELNRDRPEALVAVLQEYAAKYSRLAGLDALRQDLRQYLEVDNELRARNLGPLIARSASLRLTTPPFQERLQSLTASGRLPAAEVVAQYQAVAQAWREGNTQQAFEGLQKLAAGPWADAAASDAAHKKAIVEQFAALQKARGSKVYDERLLAFSAALDLEQDVHFRRVTNADFAPIKDKALKRAQELLKQAQERWQTYRDDGGIDDSLRREAALSDAFRTQAGRLADAHLAAQQGLRLYAQLQAEVPAQAGEVHGPIKAEADQQRNALLELGSVLEPGLLKAKLELIRGGPR